MSDEELIERLQREAADEIERLRDKIERNLQDAALCAICRALGIPEDASRDDIEGAIERLTTENERLRQEVIQLHVVWNALR